MLHLLAVPAVPSAWRWHTLYTYGPIGLSSSAVRGKQSHKLCCLKNVRKISSQQIAAVQSLWCCPISGSEASAYVQVRHSQLLIYRLVSVSVCFVTVHNTYIIYYIYTFIITIITDFQPPEAHDN